MAKNEVKVGHRFSHIGSFLGVFLAKKGSFWPKKGLFGQKGGFWPKMAILGKKGPFWAKKGVFGVPKSVEKVAKKALF